MSVDAWFCGLPVAERDRILKVLETLQRSSPYLSRSARLPELIRLLGALHEARLRDGDE